jgi:hypothetical protein
LDLTRSASARETSLAKKSPSEPSATEECLTVCDLLSMVGKILSYSIEIVDSRGCSEFTTTRVPWRGARSTVASGVVRFSCERSKGCRRAT